MKASLFAFTGVLMAALSLQAAMESASPESQGVPSEAIMDFIDGCEKTFDAGSAGAMHGFVIVRHGKVIAEGSWKPFDTLNETHMLYSHSKSFTSTAVGLLADDDKLDLDERVVEIFSNEAPAVISANLAQLRVRDLLTMNVGKKDHLLRGGDDWVRNFLSQDFEKTPGTFFRYDSDATYMLAAIVERKSGRGMMDFLQERFFGPIGITKAWSTCSPQGIPCGGWGMNMTTRELARFGLLYLNEGEWEGRRVLSSSWIALATARQTKSGSRDVGVKSLGSGSDWGQGYGFQFWRCRHGAYRADGAAGQYTVVMPRQDMVVAAHAGIGDFDKELDLVWDRLLPRVAERPLPENPAALARLRQRCANLSIAPVADGARTAGTNFWCRAYSLKENPRGFKSVAFGRTQGGEVVCRLVTRCGEQAFRAGAGAWSKGGRIRIDPEIYEALGAYVGEHAVAASCGIDGEGRFRLRAYFTGDTGHLDLAVGPDGRLRGRFSAMHGCALESREL